MSFVGTGLRTRLAPLVAARHLPRRTMRARLTLLYGALFLLSGAALVGGTYALFERATEYTQPRLPQIPRTPAIRDLPLPSRLFQALPQLAQAQQQLVNEQRFLAGSVPKATTTVGPLSATATPLVRDQAQLTRDQHELARTVNQLTQAVHQLARAGSVQAAQRAADSHQLLVDSGIALAVVAVLALFAGWLIAGRMLRPIRTITRTAQRISSASLHERLALEGPQDELKELADTLDDLFRRLDAAFEAQRQFVANASHELRTPLTRQRALIQVALADPQASFDSLRAAHDRVLASEEHLEQLIDGLLTLTRGQAGLERRERLDLGTLAAQAMRARESELAGLGLDVRASLNAAPTDGDPRLVERLIANLIDNAIRHNAPGGHLEITTGTDAGRAVLSIANSGPTIPPEQIQRLFQPFQRLGDARTRHDNGYGLGLSIVQAIAEAHHAEVGARPRPQGGLLVDVAFPAATIAPPQATVVAGRMRRGRRVAVSGTDASAGA